MLSIIILYNKIMYTKKILQLIGIYHLICLLTESTDDNQEKFNQLLRKFGPHNS